MSNVINFQEKLREKEKGKLKGLSKKELTIRLGEKVDKLEDALENLAAKLDYLEDRHHDEAETLIGLLKSDETKTSIDLTIANILDPVYIDTRLDEKLTRKYGSKHRTLVRWGEYDMFIFINNISRHHKEFPINRRYRLDWLSAFTTLADHFSPFASIGFIGVKDYKPYISYELAGSGLKIGREKVTFDLGIVIVRR